ncbi:MAG: hypothetical protein ACR2MX_12425 [Cyclobacteriaceae bacterium]
MVKYIIYVFLVFVFIHLGAANAFCQAVPSEAEKIDYLVTFGKDAPGSWGDDDHMQVFFVSLPTDSKAPFFIRVFDPDVGGTVDQRNGTFKGETKFSVYGGAKAFSSPGAKSFNQDQSAYSGILLATKTFGQEQKYDGKWYTFGPFNPAQGEESLELDGLIFKIITHGISGNDGNLYRYFLSTTPDKNIPIEGANAFTYEYSFRLSPNPRVVTHLYPFIDQQVVAIKQSNFDFDNDGDIVLYSVSKNREKAKRSGNVSWETSEHIIQDAERNTSMDLQIVKRSRSKNDMVVYITNQYNQAIPFFAIPIGGPPKFKYSVKMTYSKE